VLAGNHDGGEDGVSPLLFHPIRHMEGLTLWSARCILAYDIRHSHVRVQIDERICLNVSRAIERPLLLLQVFVELDGMGDVGRVSNVAEYGAVLEGEAGPLG
jgi:hypothetical protein